MITDLKRKPQKRHETIQLIEKAFDYSKENKFEIDFFPLMREENASNNFILLENEKVIGHIGVLNRIFKIAGKEFEVSMLGGIAIDEAYRGKGFFKDFFNEILKKYEDSAFHLLWSDKLELYEKFDFYPCIEQFEYTGGVESDNPEFIKMKLQDLNDNEIEQLSKIYNTSQELRYERSIEDWVKLKKIISSDIYIKKENEKIVNYFFMNKGEDLSNIIYEYGSIKDIEEISTYGILWSPYNFDVENEEDKTLLYAALLKINNKESFAQFISSYTNNKIQVSNIEKNKINFSFADDKFQLEVNDFLSGIFGPNKLQELSDTPKILISGLDSI